MFSPLFSPPPSRLKLTTGEIHIWRASLDQPVSRHQRLLQTLSPAERSRAERFRFERDKRRFIACRGILRTILGHYLNIDPDQLQFCYGKRGKPALADRFGKETLCFNLSHSEGLALYVFARDREVGVDIEHIRDIPEMDQTSERFLSVTERAVFRALPESEKKLAFFSCWVRKEAFIKAIGDGLYLAPDRFDVLSASGEAACLLNMEGDSRGASRWSVQELQPAPEFVAAFVVEGQTRRPHCWQWKEKLAGNDAGQEQFKRTISQQDIIECAFPG